MELTSGIRVSAIENEDRILKHIHWKELSERKEASFQPRSQQCCLVCNQSFVEQGSCRLVPFEYTHDEADRISHYAKLHGRG